MISNVTASFKFYRAGRKASAEIPGVRKKIRNGFLISLALLALLGVIVTALISTLLLVPMEMWLMTYLPNWADWLARGFALLLSATLGFVGLTLSLRFMVILLGFFYEGAVHHVVEHFRPETEPGQGGPSLILEIFREAVFFVLLIALQFIPVAGFFIVIAISSWLVGKGVHAPHKAVLMDRGLKRTAPNHLACLSSGSLEFVCLLLPIIGWVLLPWFMINMVVGQAWIYESERLKPIDTPVV